MFSGASRIEGVHPLQFGFVRRKMRTQRRYGMPIVNPLIFYPWRAYDFTRTAVRWVKLVRKYRKIMKKVYADPNIQSYTDHAMDPPAGHNAPMSDFVRAYADKIPHTHGAPVRESALG